MKVLIFSITLFLAVFMTATSADAQNDTVCAGSTVHYKVTDSLAANFNWSISGNVSVTRLTASGDSISVTWNDTTTSGIDTIKVVASNIMGCPGDTVKLAVVRLRPTVVLSGADSICANSATTAMKLNMTFTGVGPWTINYTEDGTAQMVTTSLNPYAFNSSTFTSSGKKLYAITQVADYKGCTSAGSGSASVAVFGKPATSPISKY